MSGWVDRMEWMDGWMDGWVGGWVGGWLDGWMDGWMDGWKDEARGFSQLRARCSSYVTAPHNFVRDDKKYNSIQSIQCCI